MAHTHTINASPPTQANNATRATNGNPPARPLYMHLNNTPVKRELSMSYMHGHARLFKKFVGVLTRGIGQRFVEDINVPVLE